MGFAPATRMFAGTPDARFRDSCTLTATDSSQPAVTASRAVEVEVTGGVTPPLTLPPLPSKISLTVGTFRSEALPAASGGVAPYTYSFTLCRGALPSGMGFRARNPNVRRHSGRPLPRFLYAYGNGQLAARRDGLESRRGRGDRRRHTAADTSSAPEQNKSYCWNLPKRGAPGCFWRRRAVHVLLHLCRGALPSGMGFAPATRMFAGTPDARFRDSCTLTVTDSSQPAVTASRAVEIEVTGAATQPLTLPKKVVLVPDGDPTDMSPLWCSSAPVRGLLRHPGVCSLTPMTFSARFLPVWASVRGTRTLSGTPLEVYRGPDCTYRVTDSSSPPASVSQGFELVVDPLDMPTWRVPHQDGCGERSSCPSREGAPAVFRHPAARGRQDG